MRKHKEEMKRAGKVRWFTLVFLSLPLLLLSLLLTMRSLSETMNQQHDERTLQLLDLEPPRPFSAQQVGEADPVAMIRGMLPTKSTKLRTELVSIQAPARVIFHRTQRDDQLPEEKPTKLRAPSTSEKNEMLPVKLMTRKVQPHSIGVPENLVVGEVLNTTNLEDLSSVDYAACCGLGHRLVRMSCAYHEARIARFELRSFWGWCAGDDDYGSRAVEIYSSLFHPPSREELFYVNSTYQMIGYQNDVPGYKDKSLVEKDGTCYCDPVKIQHDFDFYSSLMNRFKRRDAVEAFMKKYFQNRLVLGIHVRAGNGEVGDFALKKRHIDDSDVWVANVVDQIRRFVEKANNTTHPVPPPVLYMATDTPSFIDKFRSGLQDVMPVVDYEQDRVEEGKGVFFGQQGAFKDHNHTDHKTCLSRWEDTLIDQMLLGHADVLISGKASSFSQTLPLSIVFGRHNRKLPEAFCEVRRADGSGLECYDSFEQWCCENPRYGGQERLVRFRTQPVKTPPVIQNRPSDRDPCLPTTKGHAFNFCLPHEYPAAITA